MDQGQRVTGYIENRDLGRVDFTGTVTDIYRSGRDTVVSVTCDDGQERTAREENVTAEVLANEKNVTSILGGKVHLANSQSPVPFPLCGSGSRNTATKYRAITGPLTCRECGGIQQRRAARLAREAK
ncbi:hypothetical protein F7R91_14830 [Streptomyces luteolifulvus]|uniref:Uncharacterized protein n=1 Tax=Streptomyces luteolifulvus TaxID=2615112 RepID=A0A6H9V2A1_9ACTN|nr:hypothetical protein [Streptomyces luteolifulvus]KAB1146848.1 hypothetical protein F7R91_14830 [Streptomyces luteolifulvus]